MPPECVLIVGCGYVGAALGALLAPGARGRPRRRLGPQARPRGAARGRRAAGRRRHPAAVAGRGARGSRRPCRARPTRWSTPSPPRLLGRGLPPRLRRGLGHLLDALARADRLPARFVFVSSTGLYGDTGGEWVDEATPPEPDGFSGRRLLEGERLLVDRAAALGSRSRDRPRPRPFRPGARPVVVRFGGIYGPGRTRLIDQVRAGEARSLDGPPTWTNRIHRDDCAGVLAHLLGLPSAETVYVGVDTEPATRCEVLRWIARRLGVAEPPRVPADEAAQGAGAAPSGAAAPASRRRATASSTPPSAKATTT